MNPATRLLSSLLLAAGIVLVFAGISGALGFTLPGMLASVAVIAALLYAGAGWFGGPPMIPSAGSGATVTVFDRELRIVTGGMPGANLLHRFPVAMRPEVEQHCRAALRGERAHFSCEAGGVRLAFEAAPVVSASGLVLYGVLVTGTGHTSHAVASRPAVTVA